MFYLTCIDQKTQIRKRSDASYSHIERKNVIDISETTKEVNEKFKNVKEVYDTFLFCHEKTY